MLLLIVIANLQGVVNQGVFSRIKGYFDVFLVLGILGLPQSFIYLINKNVVSRKQIFIFSIWYILGFVTFFLIIFSLIFKLRIHISGIDYNEVLILIFALIGYLSQGLWRGIYITYNSKISFAIFTILPSVFLFFTILIFSYFNFNNYYCAYFMSSLLLLISSILFMKNVLVTEKENFIKRKLPIMKIFSYSGYSFFSTFFISLQLVLCYKFIDIVGGNSKDIAYLTSSFYIYQMPSILLGMLSPLLFNYMSNTIESKNELLFKNLKFILLISFLSSILIYFASSNIVNLLFGNKYLDIVDYVKLLSLAIVPAIISRLIMVALDTSGLFRINTLYSFSRLVILFIISFISYKIESNIIKPLLLGIVFSEYVVCFLYFITLNKIK